MLNSTASLVVAAAGALILLTLIAHSVQRRREAARDAEWRASRRARRGTPTMDRAEVQRLAKRILATSSTDRLAGFQIERQVETIIADGQPSPTWALELLKALAAERGANALVNLHTERMPSGRCTARGDAVMVRPLDLDRPTPAEPSAAPKSKSAPQAPRPPAASTERPTEIEPPAQPPSLGAPPASKALPPPRRD